MGSIFSGLGSIFGTLFAPIGTVFHYVFFEPVFNILILIYHGVGSFAFAIILLTLLIRGALFPLTRRQLSSTRKMQELQPKLKALQAQHRGDPQAAMAAQQALYKEHGVSMYGGCLPLVIQMPFLYSLFYSFEALLNTSSHALKDINAQIYPFLPKLVALPVTHFLWTDLKGPDPLYILPVLAGLLTFVQMRMAMPVKRPGAPADPTAQTAQSMQWIMPIFTFFLGTRFPSGLALYWTVSTGFSAVQQYLLNGWGSLFLGVPGMERFVPPPKDLATTPAIARGGPGATGRGGATAEPTEPARPGGFLASMREMIQQTREQAQTQALIAQERQEQGRRGRVVEAGEGSGAVEEESSEQAQQGVQQPTREKRPRPARSGAMLVRPSAPVESAADLETAAATERPEDRIKRDTAAPLDGIIADTGARLNGAATGKIAAASAGATNGSTSGANKQAPRPGGAGQSGSQRRGPQTRRKGQKGGR